MIFYQNFRNSSETFVSEGKKSRNQPEQRIRDGLPSGNPEILGNPPKETPFGDIPLTILTYSYIFEYSVRMLFLGTLQGLGNVVHPNIEDRTSNARSDGKNPKCVSDPASAPP